MKSSHSSLPLAVVLLGLACAMPALRAEDYAITTHAGTSNVAGSADGTPGSFRNPYGIAFDADRNIYVSDTLNNTIRKITPARVVSTLAGSAGLLGATDGAGSAARFNFPVGLAVDASGNVYVADAKNSVIRKITPAGVVSTVAGAAFQFGSTDGPAAGARFFLPYGIAVDGAGVLYVADAGNHTIRKISATGVVSTLAGAAQQSGFADGSGGAARFNTPWGISVDRAGNLYVADSENNAIRKVTPAGVVTTLAGHAAGASGAQDGAGVAARFSQPRGLAVDAAGNIFVADQGNHTIRHITPAGVVSTLAGAAGIAAEVDSVGAAARFYYPTDLAVEGSTIYVVDSSNNLVRKGVPASTATLPVISVHPLDQEVSVGQSVTFRVEASGSALTYRWLKNGVQIDGASGASHTIASAQEGDAGAYKVRVAGVGGAIDSEFAGLTVSAVTNGAVSITARPISQNVTAGQSVTLGVAASGNGLTYQWFKDGSVLLGATGAAYVIPAVQGSDSATYGVRLTAGGTTVTPTAKLVVRATGPAMLNITTQPASVGVNAGQSATLAVLASGSSTLTYQWYKNDVAISGATGASLVFAMTQAGDAGNYTVRVSGAGLSVLSTVATLTVTVIPPGPSARLSNLSVRTAMAAEQNLIVGVVVSGGPRGVLVRAVGPALAGFGLSTAMANPRLELYNGTTRIFENEDWPANLADTFASVGAFPLTVGSRDAAFVQNIDGARSIWARGTGPGVVLVEAYDTGTGNSPRLINVSARNRVGTGDDLLIAGFTVTGTGRAELLIRAVGPKLGGFGVSGFLADPKLEVFGAGGRLAENDNWSGTLAPVFSAVGAFALDSGSKDAALLASLAPGSYTVQVRGADGGTGEGLVEIYEVP